MLCLHAGATEIAPEKLDEIRVVRPETVSDRWHGTPHGAWRRAILGAAEGHGLKVVGEKWGVRGEGQEDLFGVVNVEVEKDLVPDVPGKFQYAIGTRHSNRTTFAHAIAVGGRVFVCDNGVILGNHVLKRKHTTGIDINATANEGVGIWVRSIVETKEGIALLPTIDLSGDVAKRAINDILVEAGDTSVVPWSLLGKVNDEWKAPRHEEFKPRTGWSLYNAFTECAKLRPNPGDQTEMILGARNLILKHARAQGILAVN